MTDRIAVRVLDGSALSFEIEENFATVQMEVDPGKTLSISIPGIQGIRGSLLHSGTGAPDDELGIAGDWYFDTDARVLYGPKTTTWPTPGVTIGEITARHIHVQSVAAASWTINHSLQGRPYVLVFDSDDDLIYTDLDYPSMSQVVVSSPTAFTGTAHLT